MAAQSEYLVKWKHLVFDMNNTKPRAFGVFMRVVDTVGVKTTNIRTAFIVNYLALVSCAVDDMDIQCCAHFLLSVVPHCASLHEIKYIPAWGYVNLFIRYFVMRVK